MRRVKRYTPELTLFTHDVEHTDGFVTTVKLSQNKWVFPRVSVEFFLHRPPEPLLSLLMGARERGWQLDTMYRGGANTERWFCREMNCADFNGEWEFAQGILVHPNRIINLDQLKVINPEIR